jgi:hypothetical protein
MVLRLHLENREVSAKAMGEALSISFSRDRLVRSSGDPLIELLTYIFLRKSCFMPEHRNQA